jgi:hypothetical protein
MRKGIRDEEGKEGSREKRRTERDQDQSSRMSEEVAADRRRRGLREDARKVRGT